MKLFIVLCIMLSFFSPAFCQKNVIEVCLNKTTTLIFPNQELVHVDIGSNQGIGFQQDDSIPGILKIRINEFFPAINNTNLLVITRSNQIYSFNVSYQKDIHHNVYSIADSLAINSLNQFNSNEINSNKQDSLYQFLIKDKNYLTRRLCDKQGKILLSINNIYTKDEQFYFSCDLTNLSNLAYRTNFYNMLVTQQKKLKSTTQQDIPIPITPIGPDLPRIVAAHSIENFIFSTPKFTMESNHITIIEIYEETGGRHLKIKISNAILLEAYNLNNN